MYIIKPIIRNFLSVIRRYKLVVILNVLGLSIAFAAFMVIMMQLNYDFGFDKFHKDYDKIYRLEFVKNKEAQVVVARPFAELFFKSSPHILAGALSNIYTEIIDYYVEGKNEMRYFYKEKQMTVFPQFFDVFTFDFVEGSKDGNITGGNVFIPLSLSRKLFGDEPAVGKKIFHSAWGSQTVMAVYRDFPDNSVINNCLYFAIYKHENENNWQQFNYAAYIRVSDPKNLPLIIENFKRNFEPPESYKNFYDWEKPDVDIRLTALPDIHYTTDVSFDSTPKANRQTLMILLAIAIVIIVIAAINFTNFNTALTPMRIKSINTQRILGAQQNYLRSMIALEAIVASLLSFLLAIWFVNILAVTSFADLFESDISIISNFRIFAGTGLLALLTGLFTGIYPARYITSFAPELVLKGNFGLSPKVKKIRNTLIALQFVASFTLIIGASFMYLQNHFMQNSPLGYHKDELITVDTRQIRNNRDAFTNKLKAYSGIEEVTFSEKLLSNSEERFMTWGRTYRGEQVNFYVLPVHYTFMKAMGIEITEGRDFREEDTNMEYGFFIFNETAKSKYNFEIGSVIDAQGEIIGFMSDVKFSSFRNAVEPMAFYVWGMVNWGDQLDIAYIKVKAGTNMREALSYVRSSLAEIKPNYPFDVRFFDEVLQKLYEKEIALSRLITLFSLIAVFISIVGVFGLVVFDSECKRKEIGIRKISGASTTDIVIMFNKVYFRILMICFIISVPFAWYFVNRWLQNFAYKTPMYWWVYLLAFAVVAVITVSTITIQNWRVANDNPVNSIKSE